MFTLNNKNNPRPPLIVGNDYAPRLNVLVGMSNANTNPMTLLTSAQAFAGAGADSIQDVSISGEIEYFKDALSRNLEIPIGTVTAYGFCQQAMNYTRLSEDNLREILLEMITKDAEIGIDFMTLHAVISSSYDCILPDGLLIPRPSRGGYLLRRLMKAFKVENPLNVHFDEILSILEPYGIVIGLGSENRSASIADFHPDYIRQELEHQFILLSKAKAAGFEAFLEGCGHLKLEDIQKYVELAKSVCGDVDITALGPLPTDTALGNDQIASVIGMVQAARCSMSFFSIVTSGEHVMLPSRETTLQSIAVHSVGRYLASLSRGLESVADRAISRLRQSRNWKQLATWTSDPLLHSIMTARTPNSSCSICENTCPLEDYACTGDANPASLVYLSCERFLRKYPIQIQNLWLESVQMILKSPCVGIVTFGSFVSGEFAYTRSADRWRAVSDFEFTVLVQKDQEEFARTEICRNINTFNSRYKANHLGFYTSILVTTPESFNRRNQTDPFMKPVLCSLGVVVASDGSIIELPVSNKDCQLEAGSAEELFCDFLEEFIIQLGMECISKPVDYPLYLTYLLSRVICKQLTVYAYIGTYDSWPRSTIRALWYLKNSLPKNVVHAIEYALAVRYSHSIENASRCIEKMIPDMLSLVDDLVTRLVHVNSVDSDNDRLDRATGCVREFLKSYSPDNRHVFSPSSDANRRQLAKALLKNRKEHYDYYKLAYGVEPNV